MRVPVVKVTHASKIIIACFLGFVTVYFLRAVLYNGVSQKSVQSEIEVKLKPIFVIKTFYYPYSKTFNGSDAVITLFNGESFNYSNHTYACWRLLKDGTIERSVGKVLDLKSSPGVCKLAVLRLTCLFPPRGIDIAHYSVGVPSEGGVTKFQRLTVSQPNKKPYKFVSCMSRMVAVDDWAMLIFAMETFRHFGGDLAVAPVECAIKEVMDLLRLYEKDGILKVQPAFKPKQIPDLAYNPLTESEYANQISNSHECFYDFKESAEFISFPDWDDILVSYRQQSGPATYYEMFAPFIKYQPNAAAFSIERINTALETPVHESERFRLSKSKPIPELDYNPLFQTEYANQISNSHECLYDYKESAEFISFPDWDDILVGYEENGFKSYYDMFSPLVLTDPNAAAFSIERYNTAVLTPIHESEEFSLAKTLSKVVYHQNSSDHKLVLRSHLIAGSWIHSSKVMEGDVHYEVNATVAFFSHLHYTMLSKHNATAKPGESSLAFVDPEALETNFVSMLKRHSFDFALDQNCPSTNPSMSANDKTNPIPAIEKSSSADWCFMCSQPYNTTTRSWVPMSYGYAFCSKCLSNKKRTVFKCSECQQPTMVRYNPPRKGQPLSVEKVLFNKIPDPCPSVEASSSNPSSVESRSPLSSVPCSDSDIQASSDDDNVETKAQQFSGNCSEHADLIRKLMEQNHEYRREIASFKKISREFQHQNENSSDPMCQRVLDRLHQWQLHQDPQIPTSESPPFQLHTSQNVPPSFQAPPVFVPNCSSNPSSDESRSPLSSVPCSDSIIQASSDDDYVEAKAQQLGGTCSDLIQETALETEEPMEVDEPERPAPSRKRANDAATPSKPAKAPRTESPLHDDSAQSSDRSAAENVNFSISAPVPPRKPVAANDSFASEKGTTSANAIIPGVTEKMKTAKAREAYALKTGAAAENETSPKPSSSTTEDRRTPSFIVPTAMNRPRRAKK